MSSTGVSSSSTGAVADRFVGGERGRFGGRARLAWTVNEERAAEVFIAALLCAATVIFPACERGRRRIPCTPMATLISVFPDRHGHEFAAEEMEP
jgi:hypothetical protein